MSATSDFDARDDRTLPTVVYVLYLVGLLSGGLTVLIGLVIAYANRDRASPRADSHYLFQIRTFWISIAWWVIGFVLLFWGIPFSAILIGIPFVVAGALILTASGLWFGLRCILGLVYLSREEPYPRSRAWLV